MKAHPLHRILKKSAIVISTILVSSNLSAITYSTLVNSYGGVFPNFNDSNTNTIQFNELIRSMPTDGSVKTISFYPQTYDFNVNYEGSTSPDGTKNGGQLAPFTSVSNLTLSGATSGITTLRWHSDLSASGSTNNPESFLSFDAGCSGITVSNLTFDTPYTVRYDTGEHIKIASHNTTISACYFYHSPNFAIQIQANNTTADNIQINDNHFIDCFGDPIHVNTGQDIWIRRNFIQNSGDDAIAIVADEFNSPGRPGYGLKPSNIHILNNNINGSQWRGVSVITADNVYICDNFIHGAARHGIEITPISSEKGINFDNAVPLIEWANNITITGNTIQYAGYPPGHDGLFHQDAAGIIQKNVQGVTCTGNTIHDIKGNGIYLRFVHNATYGSLSQIWNFGTGGQGDGIKGEGDMSNITTWIYSPGN